jgi:hypothetical protein
MESTFETLDSTNMKIWRLTDSDGVGDYTNYFVHLAIKYNSAEGTLHGVSQDPETKGDLAEEGKLVYWVTDLDAGTIKAFQIYS